jgi:cytochrome c551/c552
LVRIRVNRKLQDGNIFIEGEDEMENTGSRSKWLTVALGGGAVLVFGVCLCVLAIAVNAFIYRDYAYAGQRQLEMGSAQEAEPAPGEPRSGEQVFNSNGCSACHSLEAGVTQVGPSLAGIGARAGSTREGLTAEEYILESIVDPKAYVVEGFKGEIMPESYGQVLGDEDLQALVSFLLTK